LLVKKLTAQKFQYEKVSYMTIWLYDSLILIRISNNRLYPCRWKRYKLWHISCMQNNQITLVKPASE